MTGQIVFRCYECKKEFRSFDSFRSHELFDHGHVVENCKVNFEKIKNKLLKQKIQEKKEKRKEYYLSDHFRSLRRKCYQRNKERILREGRETYQRRKMK